MAQAANDIEVIAVDDGSTDETISVLEEYGSALPLTVIEQGRVGNWVVGTNRGLRQAKGRFAAILHQDDVWLPGHLDAVRSALGTSKEPILVTHPIWFIDRRGRRVGRWRCPLSSGKLLSPERVTERLLVQNFMSLPGTVFPRQVVLDQGGMNENLWYTADWDLWLSVTSEVPTLYLRNVLAAVRVHAGSITTTQTGELSEFRRQHEVVLARHLERWRAEPAVKRRVRKAAQFSIDLNVALASLAHRQPSRLGGVMRTFLGLGPGGWGRYLRNSRIFERTLARVRAGVGSKRLGESERVD